MIRKILISIFIILIFSNISFADKVNDSKKIAEVVKDFWTCVYNDKIVESRKYYSTAYHYYKIYGNGIKKLEKSEFKKFNKYLNIIQEKVFKEKSEKFAPYRKYLNIAVQKVEVDNKEAECLVHHELNMPEESGKIVCRTFLKKVKNNWKIYDYTLNDLKLSEQTKKNLKNVSLRDFYVQLHNFYSDEINYVSYKSDDSLIKYSVPEFFENKKRYRGRTNGVSTMLEVFVWRKTGLTVSRVKTDGVCSLKRICESVEETYKSSFKAKILSEKRLKINDYPTVSIKAVSKNPAVKNEVIATDTYIFISGESYYSFIFSADSIDVLNSMERIINKTLETIKY